MNYLIMKSLAEDPENGFYSVTQTYKDATYEIFNYRLCSYSDFFCKPITITYQRAKELEEEAKFEHFPKHTLNMRGTMFRVDTPEPELVSLSLPKFHNAEECPHTQNLDFSKATAVIEKADGSMINTFIDSEGELAVKSKASLFSDQALAAKRIIESNQELHEYLEFITKDGFTVNMEYCAPENRIVLQYSEPTLYLLSHRSMINGKNLHAHDPSSENLERIINKPEPYDDLLKVPDFLETVRAMEGIEGFVVHFPDQMVKVKSTWYIRRHHAKDNVFNLRNLADIVLHEEVDDLYQLFEDDEDVRQHIHYYEQHFIDKFNHAYNTADRFYQENKELDRKNYAIKGQTELEKPLFGYAMNLYSGKPIEDQVKRDIVKSQPAFSEE